MAHLCMRSLQRLHSGTLGCKVLLLCNDKHLQGCMLSAEPAGFAPRIRWASREHPWCTEQHRLQQQPHLLADA